MILLILTFIFLKSYSIISLILFILITIYVFINNKKLFILSIVIISIILSIYFLKTFIYKIAKEKINNNLIVVDIEEKDNYQKVILKNFLYKYIYYNKENTKMKVGQVYYIEGSILKVDKKRIPNGFDYQEYLKNIYIVGILNIEKLEYKKTFLIPNSLNYFISNYYNRNFKYSGFIKALVIGSKNSLNLELKENISKIGISHLFVVSGLHVGIIVTIFDKVLTIIKLQEQKKKYIIIPFLILYLTITKFSVSVLRVTLAYILKSFLKSKYTPLDKMSINIMLVLLINPFYIYTYSFILTYLISSMIIIISPTLPLKKSILVYILNTIIISLFSIIITLPIIININSEVNLLSILYNVIYIPLVSYVVLPLSIVVSFLPFLEFILNVIISLFISSTNFLSSISFLNFNFPSIPVGIVLIYYIVLVLMIILFEKKKYYFISIYILFLLFWINIGYFNINDKILFLDVSEGDATHISLAFNSCNIIIDTGIDTDDSIITYLKSKGIRKIDLIIISHGDSDHNGNLNKLLDNFKVKKVVISCYDYNTKKILDKKGYSNYYMAKSGDSFSVKNIYFNVLWPSKNMNDINNNSLVFTMDIDKTSFLFTGDIEEKAEKELIKQEKNINIDILKIAHHASNTSTKKVFLENVKFNIGVAMTGSKNTFGFPNIYTMERLKNYNVYYTSKCYTITFYKPFFKKNFKVKYLNKE